jgi:hypothetical protein
MANVFYQRPIETLDLAGVYAAVNRKLGNAGTQFLNGALEINSLDVDNLVTAGVLHNAAGGVISSSLIVNNDITNSTIADGKLASSISTTATNNSIVKRDGSAGITVGSISSKSLSISSDGANNVGGQINITSLTDPNKSFWCGVDNSANGFIQAFQQTVGVKPLQLNPNGGAVQTANNTLDNGSGALTTTGNIITNGEGSAMGADANGSNLRLGFTKKSGANPQITTNNGLSIIFSSLNQPSLTSANISSGTLTSLWSMGVNGSLAGVRNTLDDGSGNMILNKDYATLDGDGQFKIQGATNSNKKLILTYDTTNNKAYIQSTFAGTAYTPLYLNRLGSSVETKNNTLDDGSGNMTVAGGYTLTTGQGIGTSNVSLQFNNSGVQQFNGTNTLTLNDSGGVNYQILQMQQNATIYGYIGRTAAAGFICQDTVNSKKIWSGNNGTLSSLNNILDDGSGALTAVNILGINGISCGEVGGNPANAKNFTMSYDLINDWAVLEAIHQNSSYRPIHLSPNGGATWCGGDLSSVGAISSGIVYSVGSISQTGTTITGSGSVFTAAMIGGTIVITGFATAIITARASNTSITVDISQTVPGGNGYTVYYNGTVTANGALAVNGAINSAGTITANKAIFQKSTTINNGTTQTLDNTAFVWNFTGTSTMVCTLPLANAYSSTCISYMIVNNHSTGTVTINLSGSDHIDGTLTTYVLTNRYDRVLLQSDGVSNYYTM